MLGRKHTLYSNAEPKPATRAPVVLQVVPALATGGVERGTIEIASALVKSGWRALVASSGGPLVHELDRVGAEHHTLPLASKNPLVMRRNIARLAELIRRHDVDIVHARSRAPAWSAYYAAKRRGRHFVTTFHNAYGTRGLFKRRYNAIMAAGARVIAISDFVAAHARQAYGVSDAQLRVIHRGVDLTRFDPDFVHPSRVVALARAWRLDDAMPVIMLPGRITPWKGHLELVEAIRLLSRRDLQVLFVGTDAQKPQFCRALIARIEHLGLTGIFKFTGDCRDMPAAYPLADVVVSASTRPEGFGRVAVEAQAMGRPLVATDHGGTRETVIDGDTGWLVPPSDPQALAAAIASALSLNVAERLALAERARASMARFDSRLMAEATLALYDELLFGPIPESFTAASADRRAETLAGVGSDQGHDAARAAFAGARPLAG